jgi:EcsC protein family
MSEQIPMPSGAAMTTNALDNGARAELRHALAVLDGGGGLIVRLADLLGDVMGRGVRLGVRGLGMAPTLQAGFQGVAEAALRRAFDVAILGMDTPKITASQIRRRRMAQPMVMLSGAVGGFMGLPGLLPDATVTTLAIIREIAHIAQEEGEDLSDPDTRRACLQVFALRTERGTIAGSEMGYFSARLVMQGRPLVLLMSEVAASYGVTLSQKLTFQSIPVIGALSGAALNRAFLAHYQEAARAHFVVRRLERRYGSEAVNAESASIHSDIPNL